MIDPAKDELIHVELAAKLFTRPNGQPYTPQAVKHWIRHGLCKGTVKLEAIVGPSGLYTTPNAIRRFCDALAIARGYPIGSPSDPARGRSAVEASIAAVEAIEALRREFGFKV